MVSSVTSLTGKGLRDWLVQRVTAVILAAYSLVLLGYFLLNTNINYQSWWHFMAHPVMRIMTILTLIALVLHAWIGIWTVLTDYVKPMLLRLTIQIIIFLSLLGFIIWGIQIVWGI